MEDGQVEAVAMALNPKRGLTIRKGIRARQCFEHRRRGRTG